MPAITKPTITAVQPHAGLFRFTISSDHHSTGSIARKIGFTHPRIATPPDTKSYTDIGTAHAATFCILVPPVYRYLHGYLIVQLLTPQGEVITQTAPYLFTNHTPPPPAAHPLIPADFGPTESNSLRRKNRPKPEKTTKNKKKTTNAKKFP